VDTDLIMRDMVLENQLIFGTVNAPEESFASAIRDLSAFMERWPDAVRRTITGRFGLDKAVELLSGDIGGIKNVVVIRFRGSKRCLLLKNTFRGEQCYAGWA
jgi:hypothetical protein